MNMIQRRAVIALASLCIAGVAMAEERGTKDEAKAMADAAFEHIKKVGPEKAYKDFTTDKAKWTKKDLYVFVFDMKGNMLAHGANDKLVGKNMIEMRDAKGLSGPAEMAKIAKGPGSGWYDYDTENPMTKKIAAKSTYVRNLPGADAYVGVGIYR